MHRAEKNVSNNGKMKKISHIFVTFAPSNFIKSTSLNAENQKYSDYRSRRPR